MTIRAAALVAALALLAQTAHAEPLFDSFKALCVTPDADAKTAIAAAERAGWEPVPKALLDQAAKAGGVTDIDGRMTSGPEGVTFMMVGGKQMPIGDAAVAAHFCAVATTATLPAGELNKSLAAWAGVPAEEDSGEHGQVIYVFSDEAGRHARVQASDASTVKRLIQSGRLRFAFVQDGLVAFAVPKL